MLLKIHVDDYKKRLYRSLRLTVGDVPANGKARLAEGRPKTRHDIYLTPEAATLCGHRCGNNDHPGYLTNDEQVRLHSCEASTDCKALDSPNVVWITPIITRSAKGCDVLEIGAGGGGGDLIQHELELEDQNAAQELLRLCFHTIKDTSTKRVTEETISNAFLSPTHKMLLDCLSSAFSDRELPLEDLAQILTDTIKSRGESFKQQSQGISESKRTLPRQIVRAKHARSR